MNPTRAKSSLYLMCLLLTVDTAVFLLEKIASNRSAGTGSEFYRHLLAQPLLYVSLALGIVQMWTWTRILAKIDLSLAYPITSLSYPATMLAAYLFLGERLPWQVWTGGALITTGVLYMGSAPASPTQPPHPKEPIVKKTVAACATLFSLAAAARAQTDGGALFKPWKDDRVLEAEGSAYVFHSTGTSAGTDSTFTEVRSAGRARIDPDMKLSPTLGYQTTDLLVGQSFDVVPRHLTDSSVGLGTPVSKIGDNGFLAVSGAVGYAGSDPFAVGRAWYGKAAVYAGAEIDEHHAFLVWVDYNGNRDLFPDVPLPGFAYAFDYSDSLSFVLGFPVASVTWKPNEHLHLSLDIDLPNSFDAKATYIIVKGWALFASYDTSVDCFHVPDVANNDRLFFQEQRVEAGLNWRPSPLCKFTAAAGYAFDRTFETGFDTRSTDRVGTIGDAPYLRLGLSIDF